MVDSNSVAVTLTITTTLNQLASLAENLRSGVLPTNAENDNTQSGSVAPLPDLRGTDGGIVLTLNV